METPMEKLIGEKLSPILVEIESTLLESSGQPNFTPDGFRAGLYIFSSVMLDKMWDLMQKEDIPMEIREDMSTQMGNDVKNLVKKYCDIDTFGIYR